MDDLIKFLRERLDDDEQAALGAVRFDYGVKDWADDGDPNHIHIARHDPARVLADVAAKRAIIAAWPDPMGAWSADQADAARKLKAAVLHHLAQPYADHPSFRAEWRLGAGTTPPGD